ncbi:sugar transport protein MST1 [Lolium perenne]|uniref:sugar transport protein MST1 n=1 Tax=Lolium perenne TaxID=4522 RepID=UPI0021F68C89|nr:sugar transport protein MST1-like [Lolium perenne]
MAGGGAVVAHDGLQATDYGGRLTLSVLTTCLVAASGGLIFGYDIGISGGVSQMEPFLERFFPHVLARMAAAKRDDYCLYDSQALTAFTSSLYVAGLVSSLVASRVTKAVGRQRIMLMGGALFFAGGAITGAAVNIAMLIIGRMLLGFGVGFTNQAAPLFLAEMAPTKWRGSLTAGFQFFLGVGVLTANLVNYATARISWGWRLSLGLAGAPAVIIFLGALFLTDTPSSLVMRGRTDDARAALVRVRGANADVDAELKDIVQSVEVARESEDGAFRRMATRREYRPHLVLAVAVPMFFQLTGVIVLSFFSPLVFRTVGFGSNAALMGAVILGATNLVALMLSALVIDRYGRKVLFMVGGVQMIIAQVAIAWIMGAQIGKGGEAPMARPYGVAVVVLTCVHAAGFGWSWGPLGWVVPGEIFPVDIRSAGQAMNVSIGLGLTFVQTQSFLPMLCAFKYGTFAYYAAWVAVMTVFIALFLPETKGIPLESMATVWVKHWYWKRFVEPQGKSAEALA